MTIYLILALLVGAGLIVALITWRNAQPTSTVGQILQDTESSAKGTDANARPKS